MTDRLIGEGVAVVVVDGNENIAAGSAIADGLSALNLEGKTTYRLTAGILNRAQLLISGDSGVLFIGVGQGVPTLSFFGLDIAAKWAPRGKHHIVINLKLLCSPCTRFGTTPPCPIGAKCLQDISVDEVFASAKKLLGLNSKEGAL